MVLDLCACHLDSCKVVAAHRRILIARLAILVTVFAAVLALSRPTNFAQGRPEPDVLIIGAGIAGLSAALEAARTGASVLVVDMSTVGGGHAILSNGAVSIIGTPLQHSKEITDSPPQDPFRVGDGCRGFDCSMQGLTVSTRERL